MLRIWVLTVFTETDSWLAVSGLERFVGRYRSTRNSLGLADPLTVRARTAGAGETCRGQRWRVGQRAGDAAGTGTGHQRARRAPHGEPPVWIVTERASRQGKAASSDWPLTGEARNLTCSTTPPRRPCGRQRGSRQARGDPDLRQ